MAPTKQKFYKRTMRAFDIETYTDLNKFAVASIFGFEKDNCKRISPYIKFCFSKEELHEEMTKYQHHNCDFYATNLGFDYMGSFFDTKEIKNIKMRFNGSHLQYCRTYIKNGNFHYDKPERNGTTNVLTFEDTLNHSLTSVEAMGKMLGIKKMDKPEYLGKRLPETEEEWIYYLKYNLTDSIITYMFMKKLISAYEELGATKKSTIASTTMSLFKNQFLKEKYYVNNKKILNEIFEGYTGGHIEVFARGCLKGQNFRLYDVKSMYPFQMCKTLPNPNSVAVCHIESRCMNYIRQFDGMSRVDIIMPKSKYCLLPVKSKTSGLKFKYGKITGTYTHLILRKAIQEGGIITKIHKTIYYKENIDNLLVDFVNVLYEKRMKYKAEKNEIMSHCCKILMNSLYGKFAQKFNQRPNIVHKDNVTLKMLKNVKFERIGEFFRIWKDSEPASFCHPIWSAYITDYAKIHLHDLLVANNGIYCDTDSIVTDKIIQTGNKLGDLELVMKIEDGFIVRSKLYCFKGTINGETIYKNARKGIQIPDKVFLNVKKEDYEKAVYNYLYDMIKNNRKFDKELDEEIVSFDFKRLLKFNEALRRNKVPNQVVEGEKKISLNDSKRIWKNKFVPEVFDDKSEPIENEIIEGVNYDKQRIKRKIEKRSIERREHTIINTEVLSRNAR